MTRTPLPLIIEDAAQFADHLRANWPETPPGHLATLNLVAKAAGYRSWQALRATTSEPTAAAPEDDKRIASALRVFDDMGRMTRWPTGHAVQRLCLATFWARLPARRELTEREVNDVLKSGETFGDHVLLRRSLIDHGLAKRATDGSTYRRIERTPDAAERAVIREISERQFAARTEQTGA